jgi:hypothetical protein
MELVVRPQGTDEQFALCDPARPLVRGMPGLASVRISHHKARDPLCRLFIAFQQVQLAVRDDVADDLQRHPLLRVVPNDCRAVQRTEVAECCGVELFEQVPDRLEVHGDRNLAQLQAKDPDAARVLTVGFVEALMDSRLYKQQGEEHRRYYTLKMESDQRHLWDELVAGIDEIEQGGPMP